eukprot:scaffold170928_cov31-Tisochrysis_lutea.AAC.4
MVRCMESMNATHEIPRKTTPTSDDGQHSKGPAAFLAKVPRPWRVTAVQSYLTPMHASLTIVFSEPLALTSRSLTLPPERRMTRSPWLSSRSLSNLHSPCCTHSRSIRGTSEARLTTPFVVAICGLPTAPSGPKGVTRTEISHLRSLAVTLYSGPSHFFRGVPARNHVYVRDVPGLATLVTTFSVCDTTASPVSSSRTISGASLVPVRSAPGRPGHCRLPRALRCASVDMRHCPPTPAADATPGGHLAAVAAAAAAPWRPRDLRLVLVSSAQGRTAVSPHPQVAVVAGLQS